MCKPKHLVVQHCPLCKETLGVSSTKFSPVAFRSLLYPFYNGRKGIHDGCICSCLFLPCLLKLCIFFFAVLVLSELMSHQGEKQQCSEAGAAAAPLCLPSRGDKQISGRQITGASEAESASWSTESRANRGEKMLLLCCLLLSVSPTSLFGRNLPKTVMVKFVDAVPA